MPSRLPVLVALRGNETYEHFLDELLTAVRRRGVPRTSRHDLGESALDCLGLESGLTPPRRTPPPGRPRHARAPGRS